MREYLTLTEFSVYKDFWLWLELSHTASQEDSNLPSTVDTESTYLRCTVYSMLTIWLWENNLNILKGFLIYKKVK